MGHRLLIGLAAVAAVLVVAVTVALIRGPGHPAHADALDFCLDQMPAGLGGTVSDVSGKADGSSWIIRGQVGGPTPGPWTCRVTLGHSGAMLYLDSLEVPG